MHSLVGFLVLYKGLPTKEANLQLPVGPRYSNESTTHASTTVTPILNTTTFIATIIIVVGLSLRWVDNHRQLYELCRS